MNGSMETSYGVDHQPDVITANSGRFAISSRESTTMSAVSDFTHSATSYLPLRNFGQAAAEPCAGAMFFFVIHGPIYGIVCGFGLIGNSLSFAIMHKYSKDTVATFLLKTLAIVDNIFLVTVAIVYMYPAMVLHHGQAEEISPIYKYFQAVAWPLTHMVQLGTVWMMVLVAANRYVAICRPLHAARLCSKRNVKRQIVCMLVFVFVYNTPRFLEYRYVYATETSMADNCTTVETEVNVGLASITLYNIIYENIAYSLFVFLIPLAIVVAFNLQLIQELKRAQRCRLRLGRKSAEENNITLVMIIIIIAFIIFETPASINQILFYLIDDEEKRYCSPYMKFSHTSNVLITTNSSLNFAIYCLFRRQFRQELVTLCWKRRRVVGQTSIRCTIVLRSVHHSNASDNCPPYDKPPCQNIISANTTGFNA